LWDHQPGPCWYRAPMARPYSWRPLLTAAAYVAATVVVLLLGGALMTFQHSVLLRGDGKVVVLLLGTALLLLGAGRLVYSAVRSVIRYRGR
jgi:hypothetical protein